MNIYRILTNVCLVVLVSAAIAASAAAQVLKPTEIVYSRLPTDLSQPPVGANSPTVWAVGQDGANDRQLTTGMQPRISDDGRYLLFRRLTCTIQNFPYCYNPYAEQPSGQLWVRDLANNSETMVLDYTVFPNQFAQYSYYFTPFSNQGNYQIILDLGNTIYRMNVDGSNRTVNSSQPYIMFPAARRDDSLIVAHTSFGCGPTPVNCRLVTETIGGGRTDVPNTGGASNPSWSNDNQFIGYSTFDGSRRFSNETAYYPYFFRGITKIKPDGTGKTQLLDMNATDQNSNGIALGTIWTEDNSKIIVAARINGVAGLYFVKTDGSGIYTRLPISSGNAPDFVGGIVQPRTDAQLISNGGGVMTDQNGNFSFRDDGLIEADAAQANRFSLVDSIGEPVAGEAVSGGGFSFTSGFVPNTPANIAGGTGQEGDVAGRPNGDGQILANDVVEVQRFQIGLDQPFQSNEFQRADVAPVSGKGDGQILANDVVQTQRYQIGLDQTQNAAGPVDFGASLTSSAGEKEKSVAAPREVRVESANTSSGQPVTVNIRVDALGDEAAYGFTLNYNSTLLTATSAQIGTAGGSRLCNLTIAGQVRCSIISFPDNQPGSDTDQIGEIHTGNNQLLMRINFTVAANAPGGNAPLTLSNVNASNDAAQNLTISSQDGTLTISGPTAAGVSAGGRVLTADGGGIQNALVSVTDQNGITRSVLTNKFGRYRFDELAANATYIFRVSARRYTFSQNSAVRTLAATTEDLDFVAENGNVLQNP